MLHTKEFSVDGCIYQTSHYPGKQSTRLFKKLLVIVGRPAAIIFASRGLDTEISETLIDSVFDSLTELSDAEFDSMISEILSTTLYKSESGYRAINFDLDFSGKVFHLFKLIKEVLAFQYNDFLVGLAGAKELAASNKIPETSLPSSTRIKAR